MRLFVRTYEEPALRKSFGAEYDIFALTFPAGYLVSLHGTRTHTQGLRAPGNWTVGLSDRKNTKQGLVDNAVASEVRPQHPHGPTARSPLVF
jgi:hypothetical protein